MRRSFSRWPLVWAAAGMVIATAVPAGGAAAAARAGIRSPRLGALGPAGIRPPRLAGPAGIRPLPAVPGPGGSTGALAAAQITRFAGIFFPHEIITGPDGAMWFTEMQNDAIGRITTSGQARMFSDPRIALPATITVGPDGALWFTNVYPSGRGATTGSIGRLTPAGHFTELGNTASSHGLHL